MANVCVVCAVNSHEFRDSALRRSGVVGCSVQGSSGGIAWSNSRNHQDKASQLLCITPSPTTYHHLDSFPLIEQLFRLPSSLLQSPASILSSTLARCLRQINRAKLRHPDSFRTHWLILNGQNEREAVSTRATSTSHIKALGKP